MELISTQTQLVLDNITLPVMKSDAIPPLHKGAFIKMQFDLTIHALTSSKITIPNLEVYVFNQTQKAIAAYKRLITNLPDLRKSTNTPTEYSRKTEIEQFVAKNLVGQNIRQKRIEQYSHSKDKSR